MSKRRVFVKDNIVFDVPSDLFDEQAAERWCKKIMSVTENTDTWALFSMPDISIGITPEAADALSECLCEFEQNGCQLIAILTATVSAKIVADAVKRRGVSCQVYCSESVENICHQIETMLNDSQTLNK